MAVVCVCGNNSLGNEINIRYSNVIWKKKQQQTNWSQNQENEQNKGEDKKKMYISFHLINRQRDMIWFDLYMIHWKNLSWLQIVVVVMMMMIIIIICNNSNKLYRFLSLYLKHRGKHENDRFRLSFFLFPENKKEWHPLGTLLCFSVLVRVAGLVVYFYYRKIFLRKKKILKYGQFVWMWLWIVRFYYLLSSSFHLSLSPYSHYAIFLNFSNWKFVFFLFVLGSWWCWWCQGYIIFCCSHYRTMTEWLTEWMNLEMEMAKKST